MMSYNWTINLPSVTFRGRTFSATQVDHVPNITTLGENFWENSTDIHLIGADCYLWACSQAFKMVRLLIRHQVFINHEPSYAFPQFPCMQFASFSSVMGQELSVSRLTFTPAHWPPGPGHVNNDMATRFEEDLPRSAGPFHDWCLENNSEERAEALRLDYPEAFGVLTR
jgi:hypothetical protein